MIDFHSTHTIHYIVNITVNKLYIDQMLKWITFVMSCD